MTQNVFNPIDPVPTSGSELAGLLNGFRSTYLTNNAGPSRPSYVQPGTFWIKNDVTPWIAYFFDGASDLPVFEINATTHSLTLYQAVAQLGALALLSTIGAGQIETDAVTTLKIKDANVTKVKLAPSSVDASKIDAADAQAILGALLGSTALNRVLKGTGTAFEFGLPAVAASSDDPAPGYLDSKIIVGSLLVAETVTGGGGTKQRRIRIANGTPNALLGFDETGAPAVLTSGGVPVGVINDYAGTTAPTGWLMCFGQAVSRDDYADLYEVIGTTYGVGDSSTTFNVPDLRGRVVAGQDDMGGTSANRLTGLSGGLDGDTLGATGGAESHTLTIGEMPSHNHSINFAPPTSQSNRTFGGNGINGQTISSNNTGGGGAHNNVQPTIILNKIIKV